MKYEIKNRQGDVIFKGANLRGANLEGADLKGADLQYANLQYANLRGADLYGADLRDADLRDADLRDANVDFSCLPLHCGSFNMKVDDRFVAQLFAHWARLDVSGCTPFVRYAHRVTVNMFGKYMANLFCEYRNEIERV